MSSIAQQCLETTKGTIEYCDVGTGEPILYFHGTGAGNDAAILLEQELLDSDFRLIVPNRPGYHRTVLGNRGSVEFCDDLAVQVLNHLSIDRAIVIGTSGGGMPAASFARRYAERTTGLILQCAQSHQWDEGKWLCHGLERLLFLFRNPLFTPLLRWQSIRQAKTDHRKPARCVQHMTGSRYSEICGDADVLRQITELTEMSLKCAALPAGIQNDWSILVGENGIVKDVIACPTLIIHDREDPLVPFLHAEWSQACISQSQLLEIHAGGHLIWFGKDAQRMHDERVSFINASRVM